MVLRIRCREQWATIGDGIVIEHRKTTILVLATRMHRREQSRGRRRPS